MKQPDVPAPDGWQRHTAEQRRARLRLSDPERLAWLEQVRQFAARARAASWQADRNRRPPKTR
jgi:hypothetical protein